MMSIIESRIDSDGIYIVFSDRSILDIKKNQFKDLVNKEGAKAKALIALREEIRSSLGNKVDLADLVLDFQVDGKPLTFEWRNK